MTAGEQTGNTPGAAAPAVLVASSQTPVDELAGTENFLSAD